jgi:uncharacterized protein (DUF924 family)
MAAEDPRATEVLAFWFRGPGADPRWFGKDPSFDAAVRERFLALHDEAAAQRLAAWRETLRECLALILLLDQFPRNLFRGSARAFATDAPALECARLAVERRYDAGMRPVERLFVYLPFEHAESIEAQERACELLAPLGAFAETADVYRYAVAHRQVIARFGRFPHRNAALGRASTPEEAEFLKRPASSF